MFLCAKNFSIATVTAPDLDQLGTRINKYRPGPRVATSNKGNNKEQKMMDEMMTSNVRALIIIEVMFPCLAPVKILHYSFNFKGIKDS